MSDLVLVGGMLIFGTICFLLGILAEVLVQNWIDMLKKKRKEKNDNNRRG